MAIEARRFGAGAILDLAPTAERDESHPGIAGAGADASRQFEAVDFGHAQIRDYRGVDVRRAIDKAPKLSGTTRLKRIE